MEKEFKIASEKFNLQYNSLETLLEQINSDLEYYSATPQVEITNLEVRFRLFDSKGNQYNWSLPIETYEKQIDYNPRYEYFRLDNQNTNENYRAVDFRPFVGESFGKVIDSIYNNSNNDSDFIWEVWFIVSQLTVYSEDIGEDPRYAVETLVRGGGDCEDLVILVLDMIKSSSYTKNWKLELLYMDSDNPKSPRGMNHVIAKINDGKYDYLIEATGDPPKSNWSEYYPDGVKGWNKEL